MCALKRLVPALTLSTAILAVYVVGLHHQLAWAALTAHHAALRGFVAAHPATSALAYVAIYAGAVTLSLPGGAVLTVAGGWLFGIVLGAALAVIAATMGAVLLFLVARFALADLVAARAGPLLAPIRSGLERDGFRYLLALRLVPVCPFWLANLVPALVGMRLAPFSAASFIGIVPATVVFAGIGAGFADALSRGAAPDLSLVYSPRILGPLLGLAALALAPAIRRGWTRRRA